MNLSRWAEKLKAQVADVNPRKAAAMVESAELVQTAAKETIGHLQPAKGVFNEWAPLAESTIEALSVPGRRRCKWHGGCSTGPRPANGKAKVAENLPTHRVGMLLAGDAGRRFCA